jgi:hypothetical protein
VLGELSVLIGAPHALGKRHRRASVRAELRRVGLAEGGSEERARAIVITRIPTGASSRARGSVMDTMPPLAAL